MLVFYQHYKIICTIMFLLFFYSTLVHTVGQNNLNEYVTIFYTFLHIYFYQDYIISFIHLF